MCGKIKMSSKISITWVFLTVTRSTETTLTTSTHNNFTNKVGEATEQVLERYEEVEGEYGKNQRVKNSGATPFS